MAWTAGALLFPIIPLFWELHGWAYRKPDSKAWLTPIDRIGLKTFCVGLAFVIGLLYFYPQLAFVALSTRGDWMLDDAKDARAEKVRQILFATAGGLQWLYTATKSNPYKAQIDKVALAQSEEAAQQLEKEQARKREQEAAQEREQELKRQQARNSTQSDTEGSTEKTDGQSSEDDAAQTDQQSKEDVAKRNDQTEITETNPSKKWPWPHAALHPAVANMPASAETSIKSVAQYIAQNEKDPVQRIKALHDYVADRIAYDSVALYTGKRPSQSAETVFRTRKGVCAGYANLLSALASSIHEKIVVVPGNSRDSENGDQLAGGGHAWNAACIRGRWYLLDATWDAGYVSQEKGFTKKYSTEYLLTPPETMIQSHFPEKETWQLLDQPLTLGEFLRQPMLEPSFRAANLTLIRPTRALNETDSDAVLIVKNPDRQWLMVALEQDGKEIGNGSDSTREKYAKLGQRLPGKGRYRLNIFVNPKGEYGHYSCVGAVDFVNR